MRAFSVSVKTGVLLAIAATGATGVAGCGASPAASVHDTDFAHQFGASSDLLAPAIAETYVVEGDAQRATVFKDGALDTRGESHASGVFVISDGIMSQAHISASLEDDTEIVFELTEPVVFERHGRVSPVISAVGSLTSESVTYPEVKVMFEPVITDYSARLNTTIDVPDSVIGTAERQATTIVLELQISPATSDNSQSASADE